MIIENVVNHCLMGVHSGYIFELGNELLMNVLTGKSEHVLLSSVSDNPVPRFSS